MLYTYCEDFCPVLVRMARSLRKNRENAVVFPSADGFEHLLGYRKAPALLTLTLEVPGLSFLESRRIVMPSVFRQAM